MLASSVLSTVLGIGLATTLVAPWFVLVEHVLLGEADVDEPALALPVCVIACFVHVVVITDLVLGEILK